MKPLKRLAATVLAIIMVLGILTPATLSANNIGVTINGTPVAFEDQTPVIIDGRTLVPVTDVFRALGFESSWDGETRQTTLTTDDHRIVITIDSDTFFVGGAPQTLDVPAQIINGRNMLPIRAVLESVGKEIDWDGASQVVLITYEIPFDPDVFVRDDGVTFTRYVWEGLFLQIDEPRSVLGWPGHGIVSDTYNNPFDQVQWINESMAINGFRPIEYAIIVWAFHDGLHPSQVQGHMMATATPSPTPMPTPMTTPAARPGAPLWEVDARFANNATGHHNLTSNGALEQAIRNFYRQHRDDMQRPYVPAVRNAFGHYHYASINETLSNAMNNAIRHGWQQESYVDLFPQGQLYIDLALMDIDWKFANRPQAGYWGHFWGGLEGDTIFVSADHGEDEFMQTVLHELMNVLSLGDRRANLMAEMIMDSGYLFWSITGQARFLSGVTIFDRTLLNRLTSQNGADGAREFWAAAFGLDADFASLWDREMSQYATFEDLQLATGVISEIWRVRPGLQSAFISQTGMTFVDANNRLVEDWGIWHNEPHPFGHWQGGYTAQQRAAAQQRFTSTITQMNQFGRAHNIQLYHAGYEWFIHERHHRAVRHGFGQ